jgi:hypothetical protein
MPKNIYIIIKKQSSGSPAHGPKIPLNIKKALDREATVSVAGLLSK